MHFDGSLHPDFLQAANAFRRQLARYPGGAAFCVYHRGQCVLDLWGGVRDADGSLWEQDTMAPSFSTTKGIASTLLHILVDQGHVAYDARVAQYWPEFAQAGKEEITVRQVLTHQSGLYHIRQMVDHVDRLLDWKHMIRAIERTPPAHVPGARTGYHGLTYGFLVGEILQRVTGKPLPQLVREWLVEPLQLDGLYIGAPKRVLARAAKLSTWPSTLVSLFEALGQGVAGRITHATAGALTQALHLVNIDLDLASILDALAPRGIGTFDFSADDTLQAAIPAANGLFTARSLARVYAALAGGGVLDGRRILSERTLKQATTVQDSRRSVVIPLDMRWRLGYHMIATSRGIPRNAFGHYGFGGSGAWADPSRQLAVALIVNGLSLPLGDLRVAFLGGAVLACVDRVRYRHAA